MDLARDLHILCPHDGRIETKCASLCWGRCCICPSLCPFELSDAKLEDRSGGSRLDRVFLMSPGWIHVFAFVVTFWGAREAFPRHLRCHCRRGRCRRGHCLRSLRPAAEGPLPESTPSVTGRGGTHGWRGASLPRWPGSSITLRRASAGAAWTTTMLWRLPPRSWERWIVKR